MHRVGQRVEDHDLFEEDHGLLTGLFGVLYTISKEKRTTPL
jgi:hypothetical protein